MQIFPATSAFRLQLGGGGSKAANRVLDLFLAHIRDELGAPPLSATPILNEPFGPGEFGMVRNELPSVALGEPNYERSTYFVQTWVAKSENPFGSLYGRQDFQGVGEASIRDGDDVRLFLKVKHIFTRAKHRLGAYEEPSRQEAERYLISWSLRGSYAAST